MGGRPTRRTFATWGTVLLLAAALPRARAGDDDGGPAPSPVPTPEELKAEEGAVRVWRSVLKGDSSFLATKLLRLGSIYDRMGRPRDALPVVEEAVAMVRRTTPGDGVALAQAVGNLGTLYADLGRPGDAAPLMEEAAAMFRRLVRGDSRNLAAALANAGAMQIAAGRPAAALPYCEEALAMRRRLSSGDDSEVATSLDGLASAYRSLARAAEAIPLHEEALSTRRRLFHGDHPDVASSLNNVASDHMALGRPADAISLDEEALGMWRRLSPGDHLQKGTALANLAFDYDAAGRYADALPLFEEALAMARRLFRGDHPDVARGLHNLAYVYAAVGREADADRARQEAIEVGQRSGWSGLYLALEASARRRLDAGDPKGAVDLLGRAVSILEARRGEARSLDAADRARYVAGLRGGEDPFATMAEAQVRLGDPAAALGWVERGRAREMLDLLERSRTDPLRQARERARARGDAAAVERIDAASRGADDAETGLLAREADTARARKGDDRETIAKALAAEAEARRALLEAHARRFRLLSAELREASPASADEVQGLLGPHERMLVYSLGNRASRVFLVRPRGRPVEALALERDGKPLPAWAIDEEAQAYAESLAQHDLGPEEAAARTAAGRRLFADLLPAAAWEEAKRASRLYVVAHGAIHHVPLEALVVAERAGKPSYVLDEGPAVAYAASGSVLAWLRTLRTEKPASLSLVAVADPVFDRSRAEAMPWPEKGVLVEAAETGGQAAEAGVRPGDVLSAYGERELAKAEDLAEAIAAARGAAAGSEVPVRYAREGERRTFAAHPGPLGVRVSTEPPTVAGPRLLAGGPIAVALRQALRGRSLPPLPGTRREVEAIAKAFRAADGNARILALTGVEATEARLFASAPGTRYLHLATHGLADETETASFSALALTMPRVPVPGDDGFLSLVDLFERWRGRLRGTDLVVLSACKSQRGRLVRDEGVYALPWGFCTAGCPSAVASLWEVDDESTATLMAAFYERLLAQGGERKCEALAEARKAVKAAHPDPFHWAPFVFLGDAR